jgi:hypothetical protein
VSIRCSLNNAACVFALVEKPNNNIRNNGATIASLTTLYIFAWLDAEKIGVCNVITTVVGKPARNGVIL